jgi:hypothetical protein
VMDQVVMSQVESSWLRYDQVSDGSVMEKHKA